MTDVIKLLDSCKDLNEYRVIENRTESYELFFVHKDLETVRSTDTASVNVTVYVDHDGKKGDSTFAVFPSMSEKEVSEKIAKAVKRARLVSNQPYELPQNETLSDELPTNMNEADAAKLASEIADAVYAADTVPGGSINALEIFLYHDTTRIKNSRGIDKSQSSRRVMIEAIPTFTDERGSVELYEDHRFTSFDPAAVTAEIAEKLREVKDRANAVKPQTPINGINVVLRPQEINRMLRSIRSGLDYSSVYSHANLYKTGDDIQKDGVGDKLTVTVKAVLEGSEMSSLFDSDGTTLKDACIIKDGVVTGYYGSARFGQYLGVKEPTGELKCVTLESGTLTDEEIEKEPYIECASLSGLQMDPYNDYIGGEIRLAYYFDGVKKYPVTGITMSAKLSDVYRSLRLSEKTVLQGNYCGPEKLLMKNVTVL